MNDIITTILLILILLSLIIFFIVLLNPSKIEKKKNKVHFYVARDKTNNSLWLYLGKPIRFKNDAWLPAVHGTVIDSEFSFRIIGLNKEDYDSLKWEDEPVEVFLNI